MVESTNFKTEQFFQRQAFRSAFSLPPKIFCLFVFFFCVFFFFLSPNVEGGKSQKTKTYLLRLVLDLDESLVEIRITQ